MLSFDRNSVFTEDFIFSNVNDFSELAGFDCGNADLLVKQIFTTGNRTGCRFITVDAYNDPVVTKFYEKNDFDFYLESDFKEVTRIMFFDLKTFVPLKNTQ